MPDATESELERRLRQHGRFEPAPVAMAGCIIGGWKVLAFLGRGGIYLEDLYVLPAYRGKGYGKALLKKLLTKTLLLCSLIRQRSAGSPVRLPA